MPKAGKKKEIRQAEYSPELKQLADTDKCFVHSWLLNIVSDQCNQEQSPPLQRAGRLLKADIMRLSDISLVQSGKYSL